MDQSEGKARQRVDEKVSEEKKNVDIWAKELNNEVDSESKPKVLVHERARSPISGAREEGTSKRRPDLENAPTRGSSSNNEKQAKKTTSAG